MPSAFVAAVVASSVSPVVPSDRANPARACACSKRPPHASQPEASSRKLAAADSALSPRLGEQCVRGRHGEARASHVHGPVAHDASPPGRICPPSTARARPQAGRARGTPSARRRSRHRTPRRGRSTAAGSPAAACADDRDDERGRQHLQILDLAGDRHEGSRRARPPPPHVAAVGQHPRSVEVGHGGDLRVAVRGAPTPRGRSSHRAARPRAPRRTAARAPRRASTCPDPRCLGAGRGRPWRGSSAGRSRARPRGRPTRAGRSTR